MQVPAPFEYPSATSVEEVIGLLGELGSSVRVGPDEVRIGAMTRHRELLESDALAPFSVRHADMPLTPSRVWDAMQGHARPPW